MTSHSHIARRGSNLDLRDLGAAAHGTSLRTPKGRAWSDLFPFLSQSEGWIQTWHTVGVFWVNE